MSERSLSALLRVVVLISLVISALALPTPPIHAANAGTALQFNGSSQYVALGSAPGLGATSFTLEAWIKRTGAGSTASTGSSGCVAVPIVAKGLHESDGSNVDANYFLGIDGSNHLCADFEDLNTGLNHPVTGVGAVAADSTWRHVAVTYEWTTGVWNLYINGAPDATKTITGNDNVRKPRYDSIQKAGIAAAMDSATTVEGRFAGVIDEVRIWNVALPAATIQANMYLEAPGSTAGLIGHWSMNEGSGSVINDSAGPSTYENGTLNGSPAWVAGFPLPDTTAPAAPTGLSATPYAGHVALGWSANSETDLAGYNVYRGAAAGGPYTKLNASLVSGTSYTDGTVTNGTPYYYVVKAVDNSANESPASNEASATPLESLGTGLQFDGVNDYVTFGQTAGLGVKTFTIETWFKRTGAGATTYTGNSGVEAVPLLTKGMAEDDGVPADMNYFLGIEAGTNHLAADFEECNPATQAPDCPTGGTAGLNHPVKGATAVTSGAWHHAAATFDGRYFKVYLDGNLDGTVDLGAMRYPRWDSTQHAALATALQSSGNPGSSSGYGPGYFQGSLDEARVWNVARTQADIQAAMNSEVTAGTGLVARWGMNESTGTSIGSSVGSFPGTLTNGPMWGPGAPFDITPPQPGAYGLDLAGSTYVNFGDANSTDLSQFTLETWFRRDETGTPNTTGTDGVPNAIPLISNGAPQAETTDADENYILCIDDATDTLCADFEEGAGGAKPSQNHPVYGVTPIVNGTWYHAAVTYDGTTWRLYLNGLLEKELAVGQPVNAANISPTALGTMIETGGTTHGFFGGALDEVRIWNYARTQAEIQGTANAQITTATTGLVARWGLNEGSGTGVNGSAGTAVNGTIQGSGYTWITPGAPFNLSFNQPPAQPTLVAPANGATGVGTSPDLSVGVSDPDGGSLTVTFYGRPKGTAGPNFTIVALPDTQNYSQNSGYGNAVCPSGSATFNAQTQWVVDNQVASNIAYVTHLGDMTESGNNNTDDSQWKVGDAAMHKLEMVASPAGGIPFGFTPGNHDLAGGFTRYDTWFGAARFAGRTYYGGHYGTDNRNSYDLFSASGLDFIAINVDCSATPSTAALDWADNLLKTNAGRRGIVLCHDLLTGSNTFSGPGQATYDALKDNPDLFLMMGGHLDTEGRRTDTFNGSTVYSLRSDYQTRTNGGDGWMRILEFQPATNQIQVKTFTPCRTGGGAYETDDSSQFTLAYNMAGSGTFQQIGTATVASGGTATVNWPGLTDGTEYEWYVTVSDGTATTTGPTWSFTTGTVPNDPPQLDAIGNKTVDEGTQLAFTAHATDPNAGDTVTYSLDAGAPGGAGINATSGAFTWTPTEAQGPGDYPVTVRATDNHGASDYETITITVKEVNVAPTLTNPGNQAGAEGQVVSLPVQASDADIPANTLTFGATGLPPSLSINTGTGVIAGTIDAGAASGSPYHVSVTVNDGKGGSDTENYDWTVTVAPPRPCGDDPALVVCYPMDEGTGATAADGGQLPANNSALQGGPAWVAGQAGQALHFDGSAQYGTTPDEASLDIVNQITIAAWIKAETTSGTPQDVVKKAVNGTTGVGTDGYELSLASTGSTWPNKVFARINQATSGDTYRVNSTTSFPTDGTWLHAAMTYDGAMLRLYINGVEEDHVAASVPIAVNNLPLTIGSQSDVQRFFQGALDQVRVYNRALSAEEVAALVGMQPPTGLSCQDLNTKPETAATADKPQSKVWQYDGAWWAVFPTSASGASTAGTWLWKLNTDTLTWIEQLKLSSATNTKADVKVQGDVVHALLYAGSSTQLVSAQYNAATKTYALWALRTSPSNIALPDSETATIDIDSTGRMWLATQHDVTTPANGRDIIAYYSDPPYATWGGPITLATGTSYGDDIDVVTALPALHAVAVLWGNENPAVKRFGFRLHHDGAAAGTWDADEVPASQSAIDNVGTGMADDHFNLAVASDGTLYAAVKTSYDTAGYPKMAFLVRRPAGTWDDLYGLDEAGTRPVILLDEANGVLSYIYTQSEGNNPIVYRQSGLDPIAFGPKRTLQSASYNDVSSTKQNYTGELVTIFSNGSVVAGELCRPAGAPPKPPVVSVAKVGNDVKLTWPKVTQDINNNATTVLRYQAYRSLKPYFRPGDDSSPLPDEQVTALEYVDGGVCPVLDGEYYVVRAANAVGPSADSNRTGKFTFALTPGSAQ